MSKVTMFVALAGLALSAPVFAAPGTASAGLVNSAKKKAQKAAEKAKEAARKKAEEAKKKAAAAAAKAKAEAAKAAAAAKAEADKAAAAAKAASRSAFSAAKLFGAKAWADLKEKARKAWNITTATATAAVKELKAAATKLSQAAQAQMLKRGEAYVRKHKAEWEPWAIKAKAVLADSKMQPVLKRIIEKVATKKIDAQLKKDLATLGQRLGIGTTFASASARRGLQAPCSNCMKRAGSIGIGVGAALGIGIDIEAGIAFGVDGAAWYWSWAWNVGLHAEAGADVIIGIHHNVASVSGPGVGFGAGGKYLGGATLEFDWPREDMTQLTQGCMSVGIAGGPGVGGGAWIQWSRSHKSNWW